MNGPPVGLGGPQQVKGVEPGACAPPAIVVPWGPDGFLELSLPATGRLAGADLDTVRPCLSGLLEDYPSALEQALDSPVSCERLERLVAPGATVAIVVDDPSRWTPIREALPIVLGRLHAVGVDPQEITISVGVGRHRAVDTESMRKRVGESVADRYRCFSPPVDDRSAYVELPQTSTGVPLRVYAPVARADVRILIGSVLPHLQAGFGGGYKLIFPGTSHRTTLGTLHRQGLDSPSSASVLLGGDSADNPMRRAIREGASRLGPCLSISHVVGGPGEILQVLAGEPESVQDLLALEVRRRFLAPSGPLADMVVVGNYPWPGDPMQSFKVLLHHRAACRRGGVLVGLFWTDPDQIDRSFPWAALRGIAAGGSLAAWSVRRLLPIAERIAVTAGSAAAFMLHWACELVVDRTVLVFAPPLCQRLGPRLGPVRLFADQNALWEAAFVALRSREQENARLGVRVFPYGGLTYACG